jgi:CDP-glucose 4,6-dehydratase
MDKHLYKNLYKKSPEFWYGKKVLITGHTGFKGSWLTAILHGWGAQVSGLSLPEPVSLQNHWDTLGLAIPEFLGDITNAQFVKEAFASCQPEFVFHMAAQPLVRLSYREPVSTYHTNVMGTIHVLEACLQTESVQTVINITSDKCYENQEWVWGYRENDPMGGKDPYSSSKSCAELVAKSYQHSFFHKDQPKVLVSVRAGNVIGGGDWAQDRIVPDTLQAWLDHKPVYIRNPKATRPWQHVLEPLSGYIILAQQCAEQRHALTGGWNFGPYGENSVPVSALLENMHQHWQGKQYPCIDKPYELDTEYSVHEATWLQLDISKAGKYLNWKPKWDLEETVGKTVDWYVHYHNTKNTDLTYKQIQEYFA